MCMTRLSDFDPAETITVTPMRTFPVIRDLVTDVSFNYEKAREVPAFTPAGDNKGGTFRMQQVDVERGQEFRKCIECFLCQDTCHVVRDHEENKPAFAGPRFFIRYAELDMHPLDTLDRRRMAQEDEGLGYCNITKCCSEVCPEGIHITDNGIIPLKERVVDTKYDPVLIPFLGRRRDRRAVGPAGGSGPSPIKRPGAPSAPSPVTTDVAARTSTLTPAISEPSSSSGGGVLGPSVPAAAEQMKMALPAVGAAAGVGFLAWAINRSRRKK